MKNKNIYFDITAEAAEYARKCALVLDGLLCTFDRNRCQSTLESLYADVSCCRALLSDTRKKLMHEFMTPVDREDIFRILSSVCSVATAVTSVCENISVSNVRHISADQILMSDTVKRCTDALARLMNEFACFEKSKAADGMLAEISELNIQANNICLKSLKRLYVSEKDPLTVILQMKIIESLKKCCDEAERSAHTVALTVLKNS